MKTLILTMMLLGPVLMSCGQQKDIDESQGQEAMVLFEKINTDKLKSLIENKDVQLVDVRTPREVQAGTIPGAIIGMDFTTGEFANKITQLDSTQAVIVYCASGGRSAKAAQLLNESGFRTVYDYADGYTGWAADQ